VLVLPGGIAGPVTERIPRRSRGTLPRPVADEDALVIAESAVMGCHSQHRAVWHHNRRRRRQPPSWFADAEQHVGERSSRLLAAEPGEQAAVDIVAPGELDR